MISAMRSASIISLALLASATENLPSASLRGSQSPSDVAPNATRQQAKSAPLENVTQQQAAGAVNVSDPEPTNLTAYGHGWSQGGDKMWGGGAGMESINRGNVGYYDAGMAATRAHCGGARCALITNPSCCRTKHVFHIHFTHYAGYGANLKKRLEAKVCGKRGWHSGGLPCHGKAAFFPGFPGVFSKAMTGGNIAHASVIAWPQSCGGNGTIVEIAHHCSIEHQIRGDFNPRYR